MLKVVLFSLDVIDVMLKVVVFSLDAIDVTFKYTKIGVHVGGYMENKIPGYFESGYSHTKQPL